MKKIILLLLSCLLLTGCFKNEGSDSKKEKIDKNVTEYYELILKQFKSDNIGIVSGSREEVNSICCSNTYSYSGNISNDVFTYEASVLNYLGDEEKYANSTSLNTTTDEYEMITEFGPNEVYNINLSNCEVNDNTLLCREKDTVDNEFYVDSYESEYIFVFDDKKNLNSVTISHYSITLNYFEGNMLEEGSGNKSKVDDSLIALSEKFMKEKDYNIFNDVDLQVMYVVSNGNVSILYNSY